MLIRPLSRRLELPALTPALHARLAEHLRPDVERFREETGMAFAGWSL